MNYDKIDENKFIMECTMRLCSSLNPDVALSNLLIYLKDYIPVVGLHLGTIDTVNHGFSFFGWATLDNWQRPKPFVPIPSHLRDRIYRFWSDNSAFEVINFDKIYNNPELKEITQLVWPLASRITMRIDMKGERIGGIGLWMKGKEKFTKTDIELIFKIKNPVGIAMGNALKYQDVKKVKEDISADIRYLREQLFKISGDEIIGSDSGLKEVVRKIDQVADLDTPVLLLGETGVGKEVIANTLHKKSSRKNGPFIKVNCGALPDSLIDSELFGYEKGAFTGAVTQKRGRFEQAHNGTIFLDEIGDLSLSGQIRLLRILENLEIVRVGGGLPIRINVRVLAATNKDLEKMVLTGEFREDLYFRLNVFPIFIPPLRRRKEDLLLLTNYFIQTKSRELNINNNPKISPKILETLEGYNWPGNVRELKNMVERSLIEAKGNPKSLYLDLQPTVRRHNWHVTPSAILKDKICSLDDTIKNQIEAAMDLANGKVHGPNGAAALLKIHPSTLRAKMRKLNISFGKAK